MKKFFFLAFLLVALQDVSTFAKVSDRRTLAGMIYFTNDTPHNLDTFPVELYTSNQKRRLVSAKADEHGGFQLQNIKPGKYLLKFTWPPNRCTLWYRVDATKESHLRIRVIMDAACSSQNGQIQDVYEN